MIKSKNRIRNILIFIVVLIIYVWAFTGIHVSGIKDSAGQIVHAIMKGMLHPDWGYVYLPDGEDLLRGLLDTLAIAVLGTFISAFLCIPFSFWAARNLIPHKSVSTAGKLFLSFIRTFPEIVMAILFIKAVGPGPFAGVLALGVHSIGMLGKLYAESIESIDDGPREAMNACGANGVQTLFFGVIPQIIPMFASYALYRFEINLRSATILGLIGAGGIGTPLIFALEARQWSRVGIILLGIVIMVTIVDSFSSFVRKRIA